MEWGAKNASSMRALVASSATAFAPLSQNSTRCRLPGGGSGHAHPGQSKPSGWLMTRNDRNARDAPIALTERVTLDTSAGTPVAHFFVDEVAPTATR